MARAKDRGHARDLLEGSSSLPPFSVCRVDDRVSEVPFLSRETEACLDPEVPRGLWGSPGSRSVEKYLGVS